MLTYCFLRATYEFNSLICISMNIIQCTWKERYNQLTKKKKSWKKSIVSKAK